MRKLLILISILLINAVAVFASDNLLNTVILEGTAGGYNIVLRSDSIAAVKRIISSDDKLTLDIKGLTSADNLSTIYKNTSAANSVIVENAGSSEVKIHIQAKDIVKANIIFDTPASAPVVVSDSISKDVIAWSALAFVVLCFVFAKSKNIIDNPEEDIAEAIQKNMRDREIAMYKNYKKELMTIPSIDYKIKDPRVQVAIRRADTIRHLQRAGK